AQLELLEALASTGKPIVTLLFTGRSLAIPETVALSDALLCVWHPGMRCGEAIVDILMGRVNPSGKLVTTFPKTIGQIPLYYNHKNTGRPLFKKYNDMDDEPLFPFGFGLSYSTFTYSNLKLSTPSITPDESLNLRIDIENPSDVDGKEIVQVYYRDLVARVTRPVKELCAFEKVLVKARSTVTVEFEIPAKRFGYLDPKMDFVIEPGKFTLWVGPDSTQGIATEFSIHEKG
ncbi:MAG: glycoside hydrolase family 3 C-terminal domain-containing protein, partial [Erysipelotrichaceae bacterium]|nr:glycoside hydrolase family 3 C-terminal domain-containing protein [Erysipelotrichaceae bacterium]